MARFILFIFGYIIGELIELSYDATKPFKHLQLSKKASIINTQCLSFSRNFHIDAGGCSLDLLGLLGLQNGPLLGLQVIRLVRLAKWPLPNRKIWLNHQLLEKWKVMSVSLSVSMSLYLFLCHLLYRVQWLYFFQQEDSLFKACKGCHFCLL